MTTLMYVKKGRQWAALLYTKPMTMMWDFLHEQLVIYMNNTPGGRGGGMLDI